MKHTIDDYIPQFETTATLCGLDFQEPIYTNGISYTARNDEATINAQRELAKDHAARLIANIKAVAA